MRETLRSAQQQTGPKEGRNATSQPGCPDAEELDDFLRFLIELLTDRDGLGHCGSMWAWDA
jgi:hypothetical protein